MPKGTLKNHDFYVPADDEKAGRKKPLRQKFLIHGSNFQILNKSPTNQLKIAPLFP